MKLPTTTTKQQEILKLLYRYRFLERKQIQKYLDHTNKSPSIRLLKDLREKQFIHWIYNPSDPGARIKPAVFFLSTHGIQLLRACDIFPEDELRKRHKDGTRQQDFIDRCLLLADCCLHLEARNKEDGDKLHYNYSLEADYINPYSNFYYLDENELIHPNIAFTKQLESDNESISQTYFVQVFDISTPPYIIKKKLRSFVEYLQDGEREDLHGDDNLPIILITCPNIAKLIYAKRYVKKQLDDIYYHDIPEEIIIRFTTIDKLRAKGVTGVIWEDI
jgi:hypothetical protein